jgi:peptide chain release factor 2
MRERKRLEEVLATESDLARRSGDIATYLELAREGENVSADLKRELEALRQVVDRIETETLLSGENDPRNAIVTIHPGAGGTESQDWADMLLRMYLRWGERHGFETVLNDYQPGEEAGIKSATFSVNGQTPTGCWPAKSAYTAWCAFHPSTRPSAGIRHLPACLFRRKLTRALKSSSSRKTCGWTLTAPAARGGST